MCTSAVWGQCPVLSHLESPQGALLGKLQWQRDWQWAAHLSASTLSPSVSQWWWGYNSDDLSTLCLVIRQVHCPFIIGMTLLLSCWF